ncbi:MAG: amidase [Anaerolineales bacterium]|nr:amidase [Anaerolineales bacterium]
MPEREATLSMHLAALEADFPQKNARLHAYLEEPERFERLRRAAAGIDAGEPGPLRGQLLAVKDIFHVDGLPTRAGSRLPIRELAGREASSVTKLKEAGMLVVGKSVTTEFAYFAPGPARNPHNPAHTPGGSSSGSAAAVAAGLADLALGTQTIGSILRPASFCGVAGFKPSHGRIPADGVIPLAPSFDHVGLFGRSAAAITPAAALLCSDWANASASDQKPVLAVANGEYLRQADEEMLARFEEEVAKLQRAGYWVRRLDPFGDLGAIRQRHQLVLAAEATATHAGWFREHSHLYHPRTVALIREGRAIAHRALENARAAALNLRHTLSTQMRIHAIDLWLTPGAPGAAPAGLLNTGDPIMSLPWTQAGLPSLGLPAGKNAAGLPLGIQLVADFGGDESLLAWGADIEAALAEPA